VPAYLRPTAPTARDALLPADPGHALMLAQRLLEAPLMSNHSHGLWGYHGATHAGRPLTIQSTGIGGPSAAIVLHELRELGVERAIRIGSCTPLDERLGPGETVVAERAVAGDGTSAALGVGDSVPADPTLTARLAKTAAGARIAAVASSDLHYDGRPGGREAPVADLESAALLALGATLGVAVAAMLVIAPATDEAIARAGEAASAALALADAQVRSPGSGIESRA
jgi:purine-nucleoside phosphorylase